MGNNQTLILKQAFGIYTTLSDLPVKEALNQLQDMDNLNEEVKQVVITLFSSEENASHYIHKNFTPDTSDFLFNNTNYEKGSQLGEYELLEKIGQGGMSVVFKAKRIGSQAQKTVAIKVFSPKIFSTHLLEHFINEQKILANLSHPNIVNMLHGDKTEDGNVYLVMELIDDALAITKYCKKHKLTTKQKIKYISQCAKTLAYSHANLIIHRDLKPDNILVNSQQQLKIVDFGIAKLISNDVVGNKTTIMALTPSYAAPEQINAKHISVKTDVFSLAVVALELLVGKQFLPKDRLIKSCEQDEPQIENTLKQIAIDKDLKNILHQALAQNPDERYNSMQAFADDLSRYLTNKPVRATKQSWFYRLTKFAKRRKAIFLMSIALFSALVLGLGLSLWQNHQIKIEAAKAQSVKQFMLDSFEVTDPDNTQGVDISVKDLLQSSYTKLQNNSSIDKETKFDLLQTLALAYGKLGQYDEAINILNQSLEIKSKNPTSLSYLAYYYFNADKLSELTVVLQQFETLPSPTLDDKIRISLVKIKLLIKKSQFEHAQSLIDKTFAEILASGEKYNQLYLKRLQAELWATSSENQKAIAILEEIIQTSSLDENNTLIIGIMSDLAELYDEIGLSDKSVKQWQKVITLQKEILGQRHPNLAQSTGGLAAAYRHTGEFEKALEVIDSAFQISLGANGKESLTSGNLLNTKAMLLFDKGETAKAVDTMYQVIVIYEKTASKDFLDTYVVKTNLATILAQIERTQESYTIIKDVYGHNLEVLGKHHYDTLAAQQLMARDLSALGKQQEAIDLAKDAINNARYHMQSGSINDSLFGTYYTLGKIYESNQQYSLAISNFMEILNAKVLKESGFKYAILIHALAKLYDKSEDFDNAEKYYQQSIEKFSKILTNKNPRTVMAQIRYAGLLKRFNKSEAYTTLMKEITQTIIDNAIKNPELIEALESLKKN